MKKHLDPQVFRPSVLNQRYELTMPVRNWSGYDVPTFKRKFMAPRYRDLILVRRAS